MAETLAKHYQILTVKTFGNIYLNIINEYKSDVKNLFSKKTNFRFTILSGILSIDELT